MTTQRQSVRAAAVLSLSAVGLFLCLEVICRYVLTSSIGVEVIREREYRAATEMRSGSPREILLLGNSLLGEGVDMMQLRTSLANDARVQRVMVEDTLYFDWLFGLRRLLADGARPDVVALVLAPEQLGSGRIRGPYTAWRLMRTRDTYAAATRFGYSNTQTADLMLSSMSAFLGMRENIRRRVLLQMLPGLKAFVARLNERSATALPAQSVFAERLTELRTLCERNGVKFVLILPPTGDATFSAAADVVLAAGRASGVAVKLPLAPSELSAVDFADGFHLHNYGTRQFTQRLGAVLASPE